MYSIHTCIHTLLQLPKRAFQLQDNLVKKKLKEKGGKTVVDKIERRKISHTFKEFQIPTGRSW